MPEQRPEFADKLQPLGISAWEFDEGGWVHFLGEMEDIDDSDMAISQAGMPHPDAPLPPPLSH
ncbi:MAG: hypothetical protein PSY14_08775 [bacterium]|nr:hypothetical protein [bacterium]